MTTVIGTKDPIVNIITGLAAMLGDQTHRKEHLEESARLALDANDEMVHRLQTTEEDLSYARDQIARLENDLRHRTYPSEDRSYFFKTFMNDPECIMKGIEFLRSPTGINARLDNRKIEMIKTVRELTGLGLKESKDLVEEFCKNPSFAPPPEKVTASNDPNPCVDTSCLNHG